MLQPSLSGGQTSTESQDFECLIWQGFVNSLDFERILTCKYPTLPVPDIESWRLIPAILDRFVEDHLNKNPFAISDTEFRISPGRPASREPGIQMQNAFGGV